VPVASHERPVRSRDPRNLGLINVHGCVWNFSTKPSTETVDCCVGDEVDPFVRTTGTDFLIGNAAVPIS
jgi:hypothetical protein